MRESNAERIGRCPPGDGTCRSRTVGGVRWRVAAVEDKIVQRATVAVLNAIYEEDFLGFSYGFRPKRSQHDALDALVVGITRTKVNYIVDADIAGFFDTVNQQWLTRFLNHRIGDQRIIRLIQKWLRAGVLEDGVVMTSERGTAQGSVVSPLLANVYLHYVFDLWAQRWRRREATGDMIIVRYADDIVVGFEHEHDARRFLDMMRTRLEEFSLTLHPEKTRSADPMTGPTANHDLRSFGCERMMQPASKLDGFQLDVLPVPIENSKCAEKARVLARDAVCSRHAHVLGELKGYPR